VEWEGNHGYDTGKGFGTFVHAAKGEWPWGERYYEGRFGAPLEIENKCNSPQLVGIFMNGLPYLSMPKLVKVPPGKTTVMGQVQLPSEPDCPPFLLPGRTGCGHVDFGVIIVAAWPPPKLHQPHFDTIEGTVVVWHPWAPADDCPAVRKTYTVTGHIHFRPTPPDSGGPQRITETDVCQFYWLIGEPPANLGDKDCTPEMRELALNFREKILRPYILNAPDEWLWLPSLDSIQQMSIPELLAMKARAEAVAGVGPGAELAARGQPLPDAQSAKTLASDGAVQKTNSHTLGMPSIGADRGGTEMFRESPMEKSLQ